MEKEEILAKSKKKCVVGEMEKAKINKSNWISLVIACVIAVAFMVIEGVLGHYSAIYAIGAICFIWASTFYFCQYFLAKRPWQVLIGAILEAIGAICMITLYILSNLQVI